MVGTIGRLTGYLVLAVLVLLLAAWIGALVDVSRTRPRQFATCGITKGTTMFLVFITGGFGGIYWFAILRRRVVR